MSAKHLERLLDLLADRAGGESLTPADDHELAELLAQNPDVEPESFDHAAAAVHLALIGPMDEAMPSGLRTRLLESAESFFSGPEPIPFGRPGSLERESEPEAMSSPGSGLLGWSGWFAAAAAIVLLFLKTNETPLPTYDQVLRSRDVQVAEWAPTEDPSAEGVEGSVSWSDELQMGYMSFVGLPENNPSEGQYQLWIFDADHPAETPVDGGVFDIVGGRARVPIDAKIAVNDPSLFAITYERPGGVVVSTRERLVLLGTPEAR